MFYLLPFQNFLYFASPLHRDHHHRRRRCCFSRRRCCCYSRRRRRRCCCYSRRLERIINLQTFSVILLIYLLTIQSVAYLRYLRLMNHRVRQSTTARHRFTTIRHQLGRRTSVTRCQNKIYAIILKVAQNSRERQLLLNN